VHNSVRGVCILFLISSPAIAEFEYSGQSRQVATLAGPLGGVGTSDVDSTTATGAWSSSVDCSYGTNPPTCGAAAGASQSSNLGDFDINMSGELAAATAGFPVAECVAHAISQLDASFTLNSDVAYISALDTQTEMEFSLLSAGGNVSYGANSSGILPAGDYSLSVLFRVTANEFGGSVGGLYTYHLRIAPEPSSAFLLLVGAVLATTLGRRTFRQ
jgi:hypothetical protein